MDVMKRIFSFVGVIKLPNNLLVFFLYSLHLQIPSGWRRPFKSENAAKSSRTQTTQQGKQDQDSRMHARSCQVPCVRKK